MQTAIDEGRTGAIFALGLAQAIGVETWIRLVDCRERAPDVRLMYVDNTGPKGSHRMNTLQVEVVTYTKHSTEGLADFLFKVKLDLPRRPTRPIPSLLGSFSVVPPLAKFSLPTPSWWNGARAACAT